MSELTIKDLCPHCGKEAIVYRENEDGVLYFRGCQHCDGSLKDLYWQKRKWFVAKILKPKEVE